MSKTYDDYYKELLAKNNANAESKIINYNSAIDKQVSEQNKIVDDAINFTTGQYDTKIGETKQDYEELYDVNEVQKKINERNVAERMANLGLTDSGLNRTQQTAIQLSHGNARTNLSISEQKAVDTLKSELAARIADYTAQKQTNLSNAEANKAQFAISAHEAAENNAAANATELYNQQVQAENELRIAQTEAAAAAKKAKIEAAEKANITYKYTGVQNENFSRVFIGSDGKKYTFGDGYNPYTYENNKAKYPYEAEEYGFFSNGYQPKGIKGYGKVISTGAIDEYTGQNIWRTKSTADIDGDGKVTAREMVQAKKTYGDVALTDRFWLWSGTDNKYIDVTEQVKNDPQLSKLL